MPTSTLIRVPGSRPKLIIRPMRAASSGSAVVTSPPSPTLNGLVAWNEKISVSLKPPRGRPSASRLPKPGAESISSGTPCASQSSRQAARCAGAGAVPKVAHASTPATSPSKRLSAAWRAAGSMCQPRRSMSTKIGSKPAHAIAHAVAVNVYEGVRIARRRPSGMPQAARSATMRPTVQLPTGTANVSPPR